MSPTVPPISVMTTSTPSTASVGDVRDHLDRATEVLATALGRQDRLVDRSGRRVRVAGQELVGESLVVTEIQVGLAPVLGHEHLAVLERVHRAGVDVDVRVQLLHGDPEPTGLEEATERGGREALAETRGDASGDEDVLGHSHSWCPLARP